jgi:xylan 1,4-beta-xylosidase
MATRGEQEAAVLLWNYHDIDEPAAAAPVSVTISGIPAEARRVMVREYRIDDNHSNAYAVWKVMGSPQHPTPEQYAELKRRDGLEALGSPVWMDVVEGRVTVTTEMPREAVSLLTVEW